MKKIVAGALLMTTLVGCSSEDKVVCSYTSDGEEITYSVESSLFYDDVKVYRKENKETFVFSEQATQEEYEKNMEALKSYYEDIDATYSYEVDGDTITVLSTIDYGKVDIAGLVSLDPNEELTMNEERTHMDLDKMILQYEINDRTCE